MVLTYEELVTDHDRLLPALCEFLNVDHEPEMLLTKGQPGWRGSNSSVEAGPKQGVSAKSIGRYKTALTEKEQGLYFQLLGPLLTEYNYHAENAAVTASIGLRVRYSFSKSYMNFKWKLARQLKASFLFKSIRSVKRMLGMSHENFLLSKEAQAAQKRN